MYPKIGGTYLARSVRVSGFSSGIAVELRSNSFNSSGEGLLRYSVVTFTEQPDLKTFIV